MPIENTSKRDPHEQFLGAFIEGDHYIENMEAAGQRQVVESDVIPTELLRCTDDDLTALGFTLGDPVEDDPLFRHATLPEGWCREGSDHDMWSYIVDGEGKRRVAIFYKAAFYDRKAHLSLDQV